MRLLLPVLVVCSVLSAPAAQAGSVFLNGVNIDGLTDQTFEGAKVRIDEKGNVLIEAPGYSATVITPGSGKAGGGATPSSQPSSQPAEAAPAKLTRKYWLATEEPTPGMAEYEIDIFVNEKWLRRVKSGDDQVVADVSKHLRPGRNTVTMAAKKLTGAERKSASERHYLRVILGEGSASSNEVTIERPLVRFTRTAAESRDVNEEFVVEAR